MDNKEAPKHRRPLPTPGAAPQRPNTPVGPAPVPASSFYGTSKAPPLPTRPQNIGSNYTAYLPPAELPPSYSSSALGHSTGFREPELVQDITAGDDDVIPELVPQSSTQHWSEGIGTTPYEQWPDEATWSGSTAAQAWNNGNTATPSWDVSGGTGGGFDSLDYMKYNKNVAEVTIDGRDFREETQWWNAAEREKHQRPGPGMLPPVLADDLHNPDHSLFSVSVTSPNIPMPPVAVATSLTTSTETKPSQSPPTFPPTAWGISPPSSSTSASPTNGVPPAPTEEDVRTAVPHPNAYYCSKDNGWVILSWKSSSVAPPLAQSFQDAPHLPLPDQDRRKRTASCIGNGEQSSGQTNKTHHFHKYEKAVDAHRLTPPLWRDEWEAIETVKQRRRTGTVILDEVDLERIKAQDDMAMTKDALDAEEGRLLDLYVCCQCSFYCVASGVIPGVISRKFFEEFVRDKKSHPQVGRTGEYGVVVALEMILQIIENKLWRGESRMPKISRQGFQNKIGWNANTKRIFETLGFTETLLDGELALRPPETDIVTSQGKHNRRKLLRAWVEISAWVADYRRIHVKQFKDLPGHQLSVKIDSAREMYQTAIGAHPDQIARNELSETLMLALRPLQAAWKGLGLTPSTYSSDLLAFAYLAQCRCDPAGTLNYFTYFSTMVKIMQELGDCPTQLQEILVMEQSRDRFAAEDVARAADILGFGVGGDLRVEYDDTDVPDDFVENAWKECVKRSWRDHEKGSNLHRDANEAFRILAEARGSVYLRKLWEAGKDRLMNPDRAYDTLEIPKDVDDNMLITVFAMRLEEQPLQIDKMREALLVIAEVRDSERLRQFLSSGQDPGDIIAPTRPDLPRGLNQLGNTCYLNSLLQYFYTIKDLREAVIPMSKLDLKSLDDEKLSDDDLKRHRVGGRLVTRREIVRSKKFINQLAELFFNLEYCESAAVTPTIELAKLALVTSRDEEEDEADKGGTDSSNDTDATLVEDGASRFPLTETSPQSPQSQTSSQSTGSVLGKRPREIENQLNEMDIDISHPGSPPDTDSMDVSPRSDSPQTTPLASSSKSREVSSLKPAANADGDVEMRATPAIQNPPPLPPRKAPEVSDSVMMFGKQHDVAECMDNCMFQIETALLRFDGMNEMQAEGSEKTSVVKRLFYGKIRQRLTGIDDHRSRSSTHEKEDLFSHLPVNVTDDGVDIYDGLSGYFDDVVEFDGKRARMEVSLVDLPPLLQIQLQRVQFNRETLQPYKSQAYVKFGETIYMDRFMESADPQKKARAKAIQSELNACRERIRQLVEGKDGSYTISLDHTSKFLSKLGGPLLPDADDELVLQLNEEQERVKQEIDERRARADQLKDELEATWRDNTEVAYELTSVFVHRGSSPSWGHYFFYSRHLPDAPDSWFKYNDSDVSVVSKEEVLADTTGSTANPYLLVFARKGSEVVDTVKRFDASMLETP